MARRLARRVVVCALALSLFVPLSMESAYGQDPGPLITIINPPAWSPLDKNPLAYAGYVAAPRLRLKHNQPNGVPLIGETAAQWFCLPNPNPPPPPAVPVKVAAGFHLVRKPSATVGNLLNMLNIDTSFLDEALEFGGGLLGDNTETTQGGGTAATGASGGDDDPPTPPTLDNFVAIGITGMELPRDEIGNYRMYVICFEALPFGKKIAKVAYAVEPNPYKDYILGDNPRAYWRLGDLKGSSTVTDSSGNDWHGTYKNRYALERDPAINCNSENRATTGCNDGEVVGITTPLTNDTDQAAFFHEKGYGAVQDMAAPAGPYTVEAWVNLFDLEDQMIFQHGRGPALFLEDGSFVFRQTDVDISQGDNVGNPGDEPTPGQWFHVLGTWDGVSTGQLWVNGNLSGQSTAADEKPSGAGSTLYLGWGDQVNRTFMGTMDEVAYYDRVLSTAEIREHETIARYVMPKSAAKQHDPFSYHMDTTRPSIKVDTPTQNAVYNTGKVPALADFECDDVDKSLLGLNGDVVAPPVPLLQTPGNHTAIITCTDKGLNVKTVTRNYTVAGFDDVVTNDDPVAYYRLNEPTNSQVMNGHGSLPDGEFKNDTKLGDEGVSGDSDTTRDMLGQGGYGYVNNIEHPKLEYSMSAWINPDNGDDAMIMQHGRGGALYIKGNKVVFRQTDEELISVADASTLVPGENFHHIVGTWDGVYARLYIDDVFQGAVLAPRYSPEPPSGVSSFYVGYGEYAPWFDGELDEVSYFPKALSDLRIHEHFIADPPPKRARVTEGIRSEAMEVLYAAPSEDGPSATENEEIIESDLGRMPAPEPSGPKAVIAAGGSASVGWWKGKMVAKLPLKAACPKAVEGPCSVTASLSGRSGSAAAAALGAHNLDVPPGKVWTAKVPLSKTATKALRKDGSVQVTALVAARTPAGQITAKTADVTLRRPAKRKR